MALCKAGALLPPADSWRRWASAATAISRVPVPQAKSATLRDAGNSWSLQSTPCGQPSNTSRESMVAAGTEV